MPICSIIMCSGRQDASLGAWIFCFLEGANINFFVNIRLRKRYKSLLSLFICPAGDPTTANLKGATSSARPLLPWAHNINYHCSKLIVDERGLDPHISLMPYSSASNELDGGLDGGSDR